MENNYLKEWDSFILWHINRFNNNRARGIVSYDSLEFPIRWDRSIPLGDHLCFIFRYYIEELSDYLESSSSALNMQDIDKVKNICNTVLKAYNFALHGKNESAMLEIETIVEDLTNKCIDEIQLGTDLYRLRSDRENLKGKVDFMHVPFNKLYLCSSMRFSMPGNPCLYLGYSKDVCYKELGIERGGSMCHFRTKDILKIVDLTLHKTDSKKINLFEFWPILAACYVAPTDTNVNFKEEYIFPQILMYAIKEYAQKGVKGLRYYSCRYPDLDPAIVDYMNIALFAHSHSDNDINIEKDLCFSFDQPYDNDLMDKLDFIQ